MCGRYNIAPNHEAWAAFAAALAEAMLEIKPRYNVCPGQLAPVLVKTGQGLKVEHMLWGFVPHWSREDKPKLRPINAKVETAAGKPWFRDAMRSHRCVIPATGYYEWCLEEGIKQPYHIHPPQGRGMLFAGLWSQRPDHKTFAILTTDANADTSSIHSRMPVMIEPGLVDAWLNHEIECLPALPSGRLHAEKISRRVNSPANDDPSLLLPI